MATKGSSPKNTTKRATTTRSPSPRKTTTSRSTKRTSSAQSLLRPEHQRELFALGLITFALITFVFLLTGEGGQIGGYYVAFMRGAFGAGTFFVPLMLGLIGGAILIQERFQDTKFTISNLIGTLFTLLAMLALLEFPRHFEPLDLRPDGGGGLVGFTLVRLLDSVIGRSAAVLAMISLGLAGIILTFNITLRELFLGFGAMLQQFWHTLWGAPKLPVQPEPEPSKPGRSGKPAESLRFVPPPIEQIDEIVPTPIAARPTRASLFQRGNTTPLPVAEPPTSEQRKPAPPKTTPKPNTPPDLSKKSATASAETMPIPATQPTVQEALEGFEVSPIQRAWALPSTVKLLDPPIPEGRMPDAELRTRSRLIEDTLASFKVEAQVVNVNPGPAVTQFEVQPAVGVKVSKITSLEKDLALALAASSIRIEAPIPGKSAVGIEIPNSAISVVAIREVIDSEEFEQNRGKLKLPLGKDVSGTPIIADMAKMPHLLVAGSTGSGKSVAINAFLCGLLLKHNPDELKMLLIDPKMVEMIVYNRIPHLLSPVVTEMERVVPTLKWATREMERRYKIFARHGCRNLETYKQLVARRSDLERMPYILIVIDELADLMMMAPDEVETYICRLAQMARATGIHLIIATQRPSVDVITGLIKANFPSRIAFAVTSQVDSRVILDTQGADQLLGRGDMLYMAADAAKLVRIQGTFVSDREVEGIVAFWHNAKPPESELPPSKGLASSSNPSPTPAAIVENGKGGNGNSNPTAPIAPAGEAFTSPAEFLSNNEQDELLPEARKLVQQHQRASASMLQRRLRIGYSKAAQLIDLLEQQGVVGPADGGRSREVLLRDT